MFCKFLMFNKDIEIKLISLMTVSEIQHFL